MLKTEHCEEVLALKWG